MTRAGASIIAFSHSACIAIGRVGIPAAAVAAAAERGLRRCVSVGPRAKPETVGRIPGPCGTPTRLVNVMPCILAAVVGSRRTSMQREVEAPAAAAAAAACANRLPVARAPVILGDAHSSAGHRLLQPKHSRVWGVRNVSALCSSAQACSKAGTTRMRRDCASFVSGEPFCVVRMPAPLMCWVLRGGCCRADEADLH